VVANAGYAQAFIELKLVDFASDEGDAFVLFDHIGDQKHREEAKRGFGQMVWYATEACARQYRNFLLSVLVTPTSARFFRWDRAGVIISESFNYRPQGSSLCHFLWRFAHSSDAVRGCDMSVFSSSPAEEELFHRAVVDHITVQLGGKHTKANIEEHYSSGRVVKVLVKEHHFLISCPVAAPRSLASRATRGYWAVHCESQSLCFLKDAWRTDVEDMEVEGEILKEMAGQSGIPTLRCYGDVCGGDSSNPGTIDPS
jgi:hypothetical protein